eukprot:7387903-Prymnesium_polylepis.1
MSKKLAVLQAAHPEAVSRLDSTVLAAAKAKRSVCHRKPSSMGVRDSRMLAAAPSAASKASPQRPVVAV